MGPVGDVAPRRILVIALAAATVAVAVLGAGAPAQDPVATVSPTSTPTPPVVTETPTPAPTEVATQVPTSTPDALPVPAPTTTAVATPTPAAAPPKGVVRQPATRRKPAARPAPRAQQHKPAAAKVPAPKLTKTSGAPAPTNPGFSLAMPRPARIGVPNFFIDKFRIPPFLLSIYQAAGMQYGVRWEVLAAINEIETDYGRDLGISYAGAVGWMQFMPSSWKLYGVDANGDGVKDPYNPVDAIFAAARYLRAAGADRDLRRAIFAYNHADWYVDSVLLRARVIGGLPSDLVGSLTGLTEGRFPVRAKATYAGGRDGIDIFTRAGAPLVAVNDGKIARVGETGRLGRFAKLLDVYGNTYTYAHLGSVARRQGARVAGGTRLGRVGPEAPGRAPHLRFEIRPAGRGAPRVDPKPILDGWKLLESTAIYRAADKNPFVGEDARTPSIGQILLMSKSALAQRVVNDPNIQVYGCGQADIRSGQIDRRVLATLEFLAASGLKPAVSSLKCGHGYLTTSGNVSEHSTGTAVDIAAVNGIPIAGHQGSGSIADITIQRLLTLQGTMKPHQIVSLMTFANTDNTFAMSDHYDHIHVGWRPLYGQSKRAARRIDAILRPRQWVDLIDRIGRIANPAVRKQPSRFSTRD